MSHAASSLKRNRSMRKRGRGIFDGDPSSVVKRRAEKIALPRASPSIREKFAQELEATRQRTRRVWFYSIALTVLLTVALYHYFNDAWRILEWLFWDGAYPF